MNAALETLCCVRYKQSSRYAEGTDMALQLRNNRNIERMLKREKKVRKKRQHILLLGTGESGKSTFLKQMKIINGKQWLPDEVNQFRDTIYDNIYKGVLFMLKARQDLNLELSNSDTQACADLIEAHYDKYRGDMRKRAKEGLLIWNETTFLQLVPNLKTIWKDASIKETFRQRAKMLTENFSENTRYYLNKLDSIGVRGYVPSNEEIVWSRKPTESIIEEVIDIHGSSLVFIDVGGQTKERRKWCQCFCDMTSVLFLIACSHFDEHYQDRLTGEYRNKLQEAMVVFEGLINNVNFARVSIMMFFNKSDVLKEKVDQQLSNIREEFPSFPANKNPFSLEDVKDFMVDSFVSLVDDDVEAEPQLRDHLQGNQTRRPSSSRRKRMLYQHFTTAVDRRNIEMVFKAMHDTVLQNNLRKLMMN